jgi:hypothetical protein
MISGIDLSVSIDFTLKNDTVNPTVWKLGILPSSLFAKFQERFTEGVNIENMFLLVQVSLRGWENFNLEFIREEIDVFGTKIQAVPKSILDHIHSDVVTELAIKCIEINKLQPNEIKN